MITLCHAVKGGSGTTVVACARAINSPGPTLLVDLDGDVPNALGIDQTSRPGVVEWLASEAPPAHLEDLLIEVTPNCALLPAREPASPGAPPTDRTERWDELVDFFTEWANDTGGSVVVDAGTRDLPTSFTEQCPQRWLVTRACYLSLRRAFHLTVRPTGVVLVAEPGRSLKARDIETSVGAPVIATVEWDIRIARQVDTGLLLGGRLPRSLHRALVGVAA
ncbi:hypothetical protein [Ilumatobacter nonamiensis]|uniref:hypothetical protein n=1 Tax=Ilumatobacter nonamiensis TaxID=467093 RepID=UPI00034BC208|nr:hypothetical protein [Ilumatobacter nonamiensis]